MDGSEDTDVAAQASTEELNATPAAAVQTPAEELNTAPMDAASVDAAPVADPADALPKKSKRPIVIIAIVVGLLLLGGGGFGIYQLVLNNQYQSALTTYQMAEDQFNQGGSLENFQTAVQNYQDARSQFSALGNYKDSPTYVQNCDAQLALCQQNIDYLNAQALMDAQDYQGAKDAFTALGTFKDAPDQVQRCQNYLDYQTARDLLASGDNYGAWQAFTALGDFEDAADQAAACVVPWPASGETYRNPDYVSSIVRVLFDYSEMPAGEARYIKVYAGDGTTLVSTLFIQPGDSITIYLPPGSYDVRVAKGGINWFGETAYFGEAGVYFHLDFINDSFFSEYEASYWYRVYWGLTPPSEEVRIDYKDF